MDSGQIEASLKPLEEGLARFPDNAWLLTRKAIVEAHLKRFDPRRRPCASCSRRTPAMWAATILLTRMLLETEGPDASVAQFQQGLSAMPADLGGSWRRWLSSWASRSTGRDCRSLR